tara:strand:+ start:1280 stop:2329 length:1050 start_codon:yes stop_codon:yes gene_type:complete
MGKISAKDLGIGTDKVFFIAEAGINHNGSMENAKKLIDLAKKAGADCVKFQKRTINRILTKEGLEKPYNSDNAFAPKYGDHKKFLEFSFEQFRELKRYSEEVGILMTASGWDEESIDFLYDLGVPFFKLASADLTNFPLVEHASKKGIPIIISTGMSNIEDIQEAYEIASVNNDNICIMQCTSSYPTKNDDINLRVIDTYKKLFPHAVIGYSGHEKGIAITLGAVALGAKIIERHFTLDRTMKGGDHSASLEEPGLTKLIRDIKIMEEALGSSEKRRLSSEDSCFIKLSKSLVSNRKIFKDEVITRDMITTKGPGTGISPTKMKIILERKMRVNKDIEEDVVINDFDIY